MFSALVSNEEQEKACIEMGIEKIYYKQVDVAKENNIFKDNKVKINTNLASNFYQVLMGEKNKIKIPWINIGIRSYHFWKINLIYYQLKIESKNTVQIEDQIIKQSKFKYSSKKGNL